MRDWFWTNYSVLKDFAGPLATILAATVAAGIAFIFGFVQYRLATSQRDIARDNLRFALLERRYAIYDATKLLLEHVALTHDKNDSDANRIRNLYIKIEEARFYFPKSICDHLAAITETTETYFFHLHQRDSINIDDDQKWGAQAETLARDLQKLRGYYAGLPAMFEGSLAFKQLTRE